MPIGSTPEEPTPAEDKGVTDDQQVTAKQRMGGKQRMGAKPPVGAVPPDGEAAAASPAAPPPVRQRMGATPAAPAASPAAPAASPAAPPPARQRMGATPEAGEASTPPASQTPTRMGGSPTAKTAPEPPALEPPAPEPPSAVPAAPKVSPQEPPSPTSAIRPAWVKPAAITAAVLVVALIVVLLARWLRSTPQVEDFLATYPGHSTLPESAPQGIPAWLGWQHFLNMFFIVLIVRTGLQVRHERRPPGYWTPKRNSFFSPKGNTPKKVSLSQWLHQALDVLWVLNGAIFIVVLFATGQWVRTVPTSWDVVPNLLSTALQYASLDWPTENGWVQYNALQLVTYFVTVFVAAPLAILSGLRMSTWWPTKAERLNRLYPIEAARALHFPVMIYFVAFTVAHVALVFFTGALRNLNHMYASKDEVDWWGLGIFLVSLLAVAAAWFLTKPLFTRPIAALMGSVSK